MSEVCSLPVCTTLTDRAAYDVNGFPGVVCLLRGGRESGRLLLQKKQGSGKEHREVKDPA